MIKRINIRSIANAYSINERNLENLVTYIEQDKENRFASLWYDLLCDCSTPRGREQLDLSSLLIHLESMLYYLLNGKPVKGTVNYDEFMADVRSVIGFPISKETYVGKLAPMNFNLESNYINLAIALQVGSLLKGKSVADFDVEIDRLKINLSRRRTHISKYAFTHMDDFLNSRSRSFGYSIMKGAFATGGEQFVMLMNILHDKYMIGYPVCTKKTITDARNIVGHQGFVENYSSTSIVKYVLVLATKICPSTMPSSSRNMRVVIDGLHGFFSSGRMIQKSTSAIMTIEEGVQRLGSRRCLTIIIVGIIAWLGYYMYKGMDQTAISYRNVPQTKRIELFDKMMSGRLTSDYVERMQRDVKEFDDIKTSVKSHETN